jgi:hypothetical protein
MASREGELLKTTAPTLLESAMEDSMGFLPRGTPKRVKGHSVGTNFVP